MSVEAQEAKMALLKVIEDMAVDGIEERARILAAVLPLQFLVMTGGTLPQYLAELDKLRGMARQLKASLLN